VTADPHGPAVVAGARGLALRLAYALAAALLAEHAAWGDASAAVAAALWARRRLAGRDIAAAAHQHLDTLLAPAGRGRGAAVGTGGQPVQGVGTW
jgi:acyl-CoA dehydrogenase